MEGSAGGAGPSGAQAPVAPSSRINKRKRSIQQRLDAQVIEQAEHEARLEESQHEDDFSTPQATILSSRRTILDLEENVDKKRRRIILAKIEDNTRATIERFDDAKLSLETSAAAKIKTVEDDYAKRQLERERERRRIEKDEQSQRDTLNKSKTDYAIYHANDGASLENIVAAIQIPEMEEEDQEEEEEEEEEDDQSQEEEDED